MATAARAAVRCAYWIWTCSAFESPLASGLQVVGPCTTHCSTKRTPTRPGEFGSGVVSRVPPVALVMVDRDSARSWRIEPRHDLA